MHLTKFYNCLSVACLLLSSGSVFAQEVVTDPATLTYSLQYQASAAGSTDLILTNNTKLVAGADAATSAFFGNVTMGAQDAPTFHLQLARGNASGILVNNGLMAIEKNIYAKSVWFSSSRWRHQTNADFLASAGTLFIEGGQLWIATKSSGAITDEVISSPVYLGTSAYSGDSANEYTLAALRVDRDVTMSDVTVRANAESKLTFSEGRTLTIGTLKGSGNLKLATYNGKGGASLLVNALENYTGTVKLNYRDKSLAIGTTLNLANANAETIGGVAFESVQGGTLNVAGEKTVGELTVKVNGTITASGPGAVIATVLDIAAGKTLTVPENALKVGTLKLAVSGTAPTISNLPLPVSEAGTIAVELATIPTAKTAILTVTTGTLDATKFSTTAENVTFSVQGQTLYAAKVAVAQDLTWDGGTGTWTDSMFDGVTYSDLDSVTFADSTTNPETAVSVTLEGLLSPASVAFNAATTSYVLAGGTFTPSAISQTTGSTRIESVFTIPESGLTISGGTFSIAPTSGALSGGNVTLENGSTLNIALAQVANDAPFTVSGTGNVEITTSSTLANATLMLDASNLIGDVILSTSDAATSSFDVSNIQIGENARLVLNDNINAKYNAATTITGSIIANGGQISNSSGILTANIVMKKDLTYNGPGSLAGSVTHNEETNPKFTVKYNSGMSISSNIGTEAKPISLNVQTPDNGTNSGGGTYDLVLKNSTLRLDHFTSNSTIEFTGGISVHAIGDVLLYLGKTSYLRGRSTLHVYPTTTTAAFFLSVDQGTVSTIDLSRLDEPLILQPGSGLIATPDKNSKLYIELGNRTFESEYYKNLPAFPIIKLLPLPESDANTALSIQKTILPTANFFELNETIGTEIFYDLSVESEKLDTPTAPYEFRKTLNLVRKVVVKDTPTTKFSSWVINQLGYNVMTTNIICSTSTHRKGSLTGDVNEIAAAAAYLLNLKPEYSSVETIEGMPHSVAAKLAYELGISKIEPTDDWTYLTFTITLKFDEAKNPRVVDDTHQEIEGKVDMNGYLQLYGSTDGGTTFAAIPGAYLDKPLSNAAVQDIGSITIPRGNYTHFKVFLVETPVEAL